MIPKGAPHARSGAVSQLPKLRLFADAMHIRYVFMTFPVPSEAFASQEVNALRRGTIKISVACMRPSLRCAKALLFERQLTDLRITYGSGFASFKGLRSMIGHPSASLRLLSIILSRTWRSPKNLLISLALLPRACLIAEEASEDEVDIIHLFWGHYPSLVALAIRELRLKIKITLSLGAYDLVQGYPLCKLVPRSAGVITHAKANRRRVARLCGIQDDDVRVVYRGVTIPPDPGPAAEPKTIVVAERLIRPKRTIDVLEAVSKVAHEYVDLRLEVLGDGPEKERLRACSEKLGLDKKVRFLGHLPQEQALALIERAGFLISMSQSPGERLPNVVKEAMARRCVCIVTRTLGIDELVIPGHTGHIVEPGDTGAAAARIRELLADNSTMLRMGRNARQHVKQRFDIEKTTKIRIDIWDSQLRDSQNSKC